MDLLVDGPLSGIDQRAADERQPHLRLGAPLVVQRHQLLQEALGRAPRIRRRLQGGDAGPGPVIHQLHGEAQQLGLGREVVTASASWARRCWPRSRSCLGGNAPDRWWPSTWSPC